MQFFPHLVSLVSHKQCEVLLLLLLSKKLRMKRAGVVEKLGISHRQGAFPPYHNELGTCGLSVTTFFHQVLNYYYLTVYIMFKRLG